MLITACMYNLQYRMKKVVIDKWNMDFKYIYQTKM